MVNNFTPRAVAFTKRVCDSYYTQLRVSADALTYPGHRPFLGMKRGECQHSSFLNSGHEQRLLFAALRCSLLRQPNLKNRLSLLSYVLQSSDSMVATTSDILAILLPLLFAALNGSSWINPRFRIVLPSMECMSELFCLATFTFCPGLSAVLQASTPPTIQWFLSLDPYPPRHVWGIYVIVLKKRNHRDLIYIGSATSAKRGVRSRFGEYDRHKNLPRNVRKALQDGYRIYHKALLAWCPIPKASRIPVYRTVVIALEAILSCYFWAMARRDHDYGYNTLCPWSLDLFTYDGACSHNALKEGIPGDLDISEEELERMAEKIREKNNAYGREYHRQQRVEASAEFKAQQARANAKHQPKTRAKQDQARAEWRFRCDVCDANFGDNGHLKDHCKGKRHLDRVAAQSA